MLDERGVEHYDRFDVTEWVGSDGEICHTSAIYSNRATVLVLRKCTTPEQAIAATLGAGTCKVDATIKWNWDRFEPPTWYLSCGHRCEGGERPRFCSVCGKRVVEEVE
jgi:hypothetical protein